MSIDPVAFPLPMIVRGYACLTGAEVALASKDIDPARPQQGPGGRDAPAAAPARQPSDKSAEQAAPDQGHILSYAPGAVRTVATEKAAVYSVTA